jgi:hypothetical protein
VNAGAILIAFLDCEASVVRIGARRRGAGPRLTRRGAVPAVSARSLIYDEVRSRIPPSGNASLALWSRRCSIRVRNRTRRNRSPPPVGPLLARQRDGGCDGANFDRLAPRPYVHPRLGGR